MLRKDGGGWRGELPELELECMKALWESGELSVRAVRDHLAPRRPLAYTTVLTVLDRLARKGVVARRKVGRAHLYHALYTRAAARKLAVARLLEHYFGGSGELLLEHLAPDGSASLRSPPAPTSPPSSAGPGAAEEAPTLDPTLL